MKTRGVLYVHACPPAVCPHVEWAVSSAIGVRVSMSWTAQPVSPGSLRAECVWRGSPGMAGRMANALKAWPLLRFEVTEDPSSGNDGERIMYVPGLGVHRATTGANGDLMIGEDQVRALLAHVVGAEGYSQGLARLLGEEWDADLEPYRHAGEGGEVTWLHQVV